MRERSSESGAAMAVVYRGGWYHDAKMRTLIAFVMGAFLLAAQEHFEVRSGESTHPMLGDDDVARLGTERRVDRPRGTFEYLLVLGGRFDRGQEPVPAAYLRQARPETHLNVDDRHPRPPGRLQNARGPRDELLRRLGIDRDDDGLAIHDDGCRAGSVER